MDNDKPCQATPHGTLLEQIMDSNLPKSEREWAAARELAAKDEEIEELKSTCQKQAAEYFKQDAEIERLTKENEQNRKAYEDSLDYAFEQNEVMFKENERMREVVNKLIPRVHELRNNTLNSGSPFVLDLNEDIEFAKQAIEGREKG